MSSRRTISIISLILFICSMAAFGQEQQAQQPQGKSLSLTLDDCIARALQKNLGIQAAILSPQVSDAALVQSREKYYPSLSFNYTDTSNNSGSYSWVDASQTVTSTGNNYSAQISQLIPIGGNFTIRLSGNMTDTNSRGQTVNPRYQSTLRFDFTQPLLQGFGYKMTNYNIFVARNNLDISETQFDKTVQDTVYSVTQAYWQLVYSIENLKVQRLALQLARDLLAKNQRSVEIGTLAPLDVLTAQSEVATREANILAAEAAVKGAEDQIKMLINLSDEEEKGLREVMALDQPKFEEQKVDLDQALAIAMQKRTDLKISQIGLQIQDLNLSYTRNQLLPSLNFTVSYWSPGLGGTLLLYDNPNPLLGTLIGTVPGGGSQALKDAFNFKYKNWQVSLSLGIPLSNMISRASLAQAKLNLDQALLDLKNQEKQVVLEIKNAVRNVDTTYKQVLAYKVARDLAEKKLQAEEEKLRVGLSTDYFVLQYQRDLTNARVAELQAIINYNLAQVSLDRSTGTILEKKKIKITDILTRS